MLQREVSVYQIGSVVVTASVYQLLCYVMVMMIVKIIPTNTLNIVPANVLKDSSNVQIMVSYSSISFSVY